MHRYKLTVEYDGTGLSGWQRQPNVPSVQQHLEDAVEKLCGEKITSQVAGRTDAGVHAIAQISHVDLPKEYDPFVVQQALNYYLHDTRIVIEAVEAVDEEFHARFSAKSRHYLYRILNRRAPSALDRERVWHVPVVLDVDKMREAANLLIGTHDFSSFRDTHCQAKSPIKTLDKLDITPHGEEIHITCEAQSFLHHQVRIMTGTLAWVGRNKWQLSDVQKALDAKYRAAGGPTAPAHGLYLVRVGYDGAK